MLNSSLQLERIDSHHQIKNQVVYQRAKEKESSVKSQKVMELMKTLVRALRWRNHTNSH